MGAILMVLGEYCPGMIKVSLNIFNFLQHLYDETTDIIFQNNTNILYRSLSGNIITFSEGLGSIMTKKINSHKYIMLIS